MILIKMLKTTQDRYLCVASCLGQSALLCKNFTVNMLKHICNQYSYRKRNQPKILPQKIASC